MKKSSGGLIVFFASIFVGLLITFNTNFGEIIKNSTQLSAKDYQDAVNERSDLYKEISNLTERNNEIQNTINKYKKDDKKQEKVLNTMKEQLNDYGMVTGLTKVSGPGILLEINDGNIDKETDDAFKTKSKIFHDNDMALVLNDLRKAGAEAISINSHRVISNTGVICNWAFLGFNDDVTEYAPFYIYAIGDPDVLESALLDEESYIKKLMFRELSVKIEKKDNIVIAHDNNANFTEYMKQYTKK